MDTTHRAPDLILTGGHVPSLPVVPTAGAGTEVAGSASRPDATTVAVRGGRIVAVGDDGVRSLAGPGTRVMDVRGGAILPGINDGHLHFVASAVARSLLLDIGATRAGSWGEVRSLVRAASPGADGWIRATGWDEVTLGPGGPDAVADLRPDVPVVLFDQTGHALLLNATACRAAGLTADTAPVPGGTIGRWPDGTPNGLLGDGAMELACARIPSLPATALTAAFADYQAVLHGWGITSLTEPGLGPGGAGLLGGSSDTASLCALADWAATGGLTLRTQVLLLFTGTGGASADAVRAGLATGLDAVATDRGIDPDLLRVAGVKVFADGTPRAGTAWMSHDYRTPCGHGHGAMVIRGESDDERVRELGAIIDAIHDAGLQAGIHATGDATTAAAVDAIVRAQHRAPRDARHYVIHGAFADRAQVERLGRAGIGYSTNPAIRAAAGGLVERVLGADHLRDHQPLATAVRAGVGVNIASDSPVTTADWRSSILAAVTRDTAAGPAPRDDPERVDVRTALALMTSGPAWQDHAGDRKGRIAPGYLADLCVLDEPLPEEPHRLSRTSTVITVSGGHLVHQA